MQTVTIGEYFFVYVRVQHGRLKKKIHVPAPKACWTKESDIGDFFNELYRRSWIKKTETEIPKVSALTKLKLLKVNLLFQRDAENEYIAQKNREHEMKKQSQKNNIKVRQYR